MHHSCCSKAGCSSDSHSNRDNHRQMPTSDHDCISSSGYTCHSNSCSHTDRHSCICYHFFLLCSHMLHVLFPANNIHHQEFGRIYIPCYSYSLPQQIKGGVKIWHSYNSGLLIST